ncbi:hypothetical protein DB345_05965 [Spartobacteria bacterium LR76]|nr:hypothetical protein DB345_05965 [Spartobacteria bacterium LR76]
MRLDLSPFKIPSSEYSQCPFWFWNDALEEREIVRQMADFRDHGVEAFVIHPRLGLPKTSGWLSEELFGFMRIALEEARKHGMWVMLYDEGMYPSGSSAGQVVASDARFHARGLVCERVGEQEEGGPLDRRILRKIKRQGGGEFYVIDQKIDSVIRGLHYHDEGKGEELEHAAADLLNPAAVKCFIDLVYERFFKELGKYFGTTVRGIFTDEPNPLGRVRTAGAVAGTSDILEHVARFIGRDFTPFLATLWFDDEQDALTHRRLYNEAIAARLDETYYQPLSQWCANHGVALAGHPARPDDIGHLRHFQIPGQDIVWRDIEPGRTTALEGAPSTMAKAAASVAYHESRTRNLNEFAGAYGESLTFEELQWLASWLIIRGCNLLVPHAFYYSLRGVRRHERPPDVGPNSAWWAEYKTWADFTRRLCWLNVIGQPVCEVAILGGAIELPWRAAKACFENQVDFHYVTARDIASSAVVEDCLCIGPGRYRAILIEQGYEVELPPGAPVVKWGEIPPQDFFDRVTPVVRLDRPAASLRCRHLLAGGGNYHVFLMFNEGSELLSREIAFPVKGRMMRLNPLTGNVSEHESLKYLQLEAHAWEVVLIWESR